MNLKLSFADKVDEIDCKTTTMGVNFKGTSSSFTKTKAGHTCQAWNSQKPHTHSMTNDDFPEGSIDIAKNYCRNPKGYRLSPWCFIVNGTENGKNWEECNIPTCTAATG